MGKEEKEEGEGERGEGREGNRRKGKGEREERRKGEGKREGEGKKVSGEGSNRTSNSALCRLLPAEDAKGRNGHQG